MYIHKKHVPLPSGSSTHVEFNHVDWTSDMSSQARVAHSQRLEPSGTWLWPHNQDLDLW